MLQVPASPERSFIKFNKRTHWKVAQHKSSNCMIIKFEINDRSSHPLRFELEESLESMLGVIKV